MLSKRRTWCLGQLIPFPIQQWGWLPKNYHSHNNLHQYKNWFNIKKLLNQIIAAAGIIFCFRIELSGWLPFIKVWITPIQPYYLQSVPKLSFKVFHMICAIKLAIEVKWIRKCNTKCFKGSNYYSQNHLNECQNLLYNITFSEQITKILTWSRFRKTSILILLTIKFVYSNTICSCISRWIAFMHEFSDWHLLKTLDCSNSSIS